MKAYIRNFSIIAHIDHGKTTLTDQLLKRTGTVSPLEDAQRILDSNPIEKERGITIKLAPVTMIYKLKAISYKLNLIDTPGHVDFSYEVSRSLAACEGALLLVDATQGIQAQTVAHTREALDLGLVLLPAINKIDLARERVNDVIDQLEETFGFKKEDILLISAKTGEGIDELLQEIVNRLPPPGGEEDAPPRALVFNSIFDTHLGVIAFIRIVDGQITDQQSLTLIADQSPVSVKEIGIFTPNRKSVEKLNTGEVGYVATGLKDMRIVRVGDTLTEMLAAKSIQPLPGFRSPKPVVYADIFPTQEGNFNELKRAVERLKLTDAAIAIAQTQTKTLGAGFRLGFLGLFHSEITKERLQREQGVETILTKPTVEYEVITKNGEKLSIKHPSDLPDPSQINEIMEPMVIVIVVTPRSYLGPLMQLFQERRGIYQNTHYIGEQVQVVYELPLAELISGFVDQLKSVSHGFASLDYKHIDSKSVDALKLSILLNLQEVEPLARIVVRQYAQREGKAIVERLKEVLPKQLFAVPIQAAIGGKIIARETKAAARKDVTAKLYGGDRTRRMKLLEKQKKGKQKLAQLGRISLPQEIFTQIMKA